jgi:predicted metal-dependent TIM-barrel fold hydrolase
MSKSKDYEVMTNPELLSHFEKNGVEISAGLHNELAVIRGVMHDPQADAAHDKAVTILRGRDSSKIAIRSNLISAASFVVAVAALVVAILKH